MESLSWQEVANRKREAILAAIPAEWRLEKLPSVEEQVDVTEYVKQYFNNKELDITESSADVIAKKVAEGQWSALEVTRAFCHRAAVAHQLVCVHYCYAQC
jgi:amidase